MHHQPHVAVRDFDAVALFHALDGLRTQAGLSWQGVADAIWDLSEQLNRRRPGDHPISPATIRSMGRRGAISCQHALFMLRWLGRAPEEFLTALPGPDGAGAAHPALPAAGADRRLRWDLKALHGALDEQRRQQGLTWAELARQLRCTPSQLTGLRTARFAASMNVAMHIVQWLGRPAADFVYPARW